MKIKAENGLVYYNYFAGTGFWDAVSPKSGLPRGITPFNSSGGGESIDRLPPR